MFLYRKIYPFIFLFYLKIKEKAIIFNELIYIKDVIILSG